MSIFDQPHIFIVFSAGSSGNFLAGTINSLLNGSQQGIDISSVGSSHTLSRNKSQGKDFLSFGTLFEEHQMFNSESAREAFYLDNIKKTYNELSSPEVVWTHDFTNIPLYQKHFKNSKILVITNQTANEKLQAVIMHSLKTFVDKNGITPVNDKLGAIALERWRTHCSNELAELFDYQVASKMVQDNLNEEYKDALTYGTIRMLLKFYGMLAQVEDVPARHCIFDHVFYIIKNSNPPFKLGPRLDSFITDDCITLPYSYLANNDCNLLSAKIATVLDKQLTSEDERYIKESFDNYRNAQHQLLLSDPVKFYTDLKNKVLTTSSI